MLRGGGREAHCQPRKLDALAKALLEHETLDEADASTAASIPRPPREEVLEAVSFDGVAGG